MEFEIKKYCVECKDNTLHLVSGSGNKSMCGNHHDTDLVLTGLEIAKLEKQAKINEKSDTATDKLKVEVKQNDI